MVVDMVIDVSQTVLGQLIEPELARWKVPGLELAIVKGDDVLFAGGFGTANVATGAPVEPTTLFHHGSTGKLMTALLVAILVEEGLLDWDRCVREYLPEFRLIDPVLTERVTVRDLLAHRTGVGSHDFMWLANPSWARPELVRRLRYLDTAHDLRTEFVYWNCGYAVVGHVIGAVTDSTWEEQLRLRVLDSSRDVQRRHLGPGGCRGRGSLHGLRGPRRGGEGGFLPAHRCRSTGRRSCTARSTLRPGCASWLMTGNSTAVGWCLRTSSVS